MSSNTVLSEATSLERLEGLTVAGYGITIPWPNRTAENSTGESHDYTLRLGMSFHPGNVTPNLKSTVNADKISALPPAIQELFQKSQSASLRCGVWPFHELAAIDTSGEVPVEAVPFPSYYTWKEDRTVVSGINHTYMSGGLGIGVGCEFCGASVMVEYEKEMTKKSDSCKASTISRIVKSTVRLQQLPSLTHAAKEVLCEAGPEVFQSIYGTHFVSGFLLGNELGWAFSQQCTQTEEKDAMKLLVEVHFLFWSASHEEQLAAWEKIETSESTPFILYDTATQKLENRCLKDVTPESFVKLSREVQERLESQSSRVDKATEEVRKSALADVSKSEYILAIILSPWTVLNGTEQLRSVPRTNIH
ncbi:hypothetical protein F5884DRAFT_318716 [Xylogone sp. PMI_703]|nr:hypothetical protein F5884DRAFT_318716 [Xylogone sp. PMI_703]